MMENEALQVIQKMNVKINGTEDEVKKFHEAMEVAKRALKKGIEVHPLGALHDVKKGTLYTCSNCALPCHCEERSVLGSPTGRAVTEGD